MSTRKQNTSPECFVLCINKNTSASLNEEKAEFSTFKYRDLWSGKGLVGIYGCERKAVTPLETAGICIDYSENLTDITVTPHDQPD